METEAGGGSPGFQARGREGTEDRWQVSVLAESALWFVKQQTQDACGLRGAPGRGFCLLSTGLTHPIAGSGARVKAGPQPRSPGKGQEGVAPSLSAWLEASTEHSSQWAGAFLCVWPPLAGRPTRQAMGGGKSGICFLFQASLLYQAGLGPGLPLGTQPLLLWVTSGHLISLELQSPRLEGGDGDSHSPVGPWVPAAPSQPQLLPPTGSDLVFADKTRQRERDISEGRWGPRCM